MMSKKSPAIELIADMFKAAAILGVMLYVAIFTNGGPAGAMRAISAAVIVYSVFLIVADFYPKERKTRGRLQSVIYSIRDVCQMWFSQGKPSTKDKMRKHK